MAVVSLKINEPVHDTALIGTGDLTLRGSITAKPPELNQVPLYYRWYSSLFVAKKGRYSINETALTHPGNGLVTNLEIGTQVITLAASDRAGETDADLEAIQHGGMTGGSDGDGECVVHVFIAHLLSPANGAEINQSEAILEARAPSLWGVTTDIPEVYAINPDYHPLNRIRYRWEFIPLGSPPGRSRMDFIPAIEEYEFDPEMDSELIRIRYRGPLPSGLIAGYTLRLHAEDNQEILGGDQVSVSVTVVP